MHKILILFLLFSSSHMFAQPGVAPKKEVNGKMYYVHKVEQGNTLWGLQQMYKVKVEDIVRANPELSDGLKTGNEVLIPIEQKVKPVTSAATSSDYKVKRGETLYGLSRKFETTVDELVRLNPELEESGLQKNQIIKVPGIVDTAVSDPVVDPVDTVPNPFDNGGDDQESVSVTFSDSTIRHTVMARETMYSVSRRFMVPIETIMKVNNLRSMRIKEGQILIIPIKNERIEKVPVKSVPLAYNPLSNDSLVFEKKEKYKVLVLLPFHLDYGANYKQNISNFATQFYMGASLALDSLEAMGLNADVHFVDTKNDSSTVSALVNSSKFYNVDLVIGPFFGQNHEIVARYCKENKVRMVCPVASNSKLLENNRLVYSCVPSDITLMNNLAEHVLASHSGENIILVKPTTEKDKVLYDAFRKSYMESTIVGVRPGIIETTIDEMKVFVKKESNNVIVMPTVDSRTAVKFMSTLNKFSFKSKKNNIVVYGTKEWVDNKDLNDFYKNKYNYRFATANFADYYTDEMKEMNRSYRSIYKTDMSKMAIQGYDVMMYFCSDFFLETSSPALLMNSFDMKQISERDGYENVNIYVIEQEDYELINTMEFTNE